MSWARTFGSALLLVGPGGCLWISGAEHVLRTDQDQDGVPAPVDCNDLNGGIYPGAPEIPCDSVDNDCNATSTDGPASLLSTSASGEAETATFDSIEKALLGARPGDTLLVCAGRWNQSLVITVPNLTLTGSSVPEATVFDGDGIDSPVIEIRAADVTLRNLTLENGVGRDREGSGTWGGGVYAVDAPGKLTLDRVIVANSLANQGGGVAAPEAGELVMTGSVVRGNRATTSGGGVYVTATATFTDSFLVENVADAEGGGLGIGAGAQVTLAGTTELRENTARSGGGVVIEARGSLVGGAILENEALETGGGVASHTGDLTDVRIEKNVAGEAGGGLTIFGGTVTRGSLVENTAPTGGGMHVTGNVDLRGTRFEKNTAEEDDGGGIVVVDGLLSIADDGVGDGFTPTTFFENVSYDDGGAIAAVGGSLEMVGGEIENCVSERGGAIAIVDDGSCSGCTYALDGLRIVENAAARDGGAIWTNQSVTLESVELTGNGTYGDGGALYATGTAVVSIRGGTASGNIASGGAVAAFDVGDALTPSTIVSVTFSSNEAYEGSVFLITSGTVEAAASLFSDNESGSSGAVAIERDGVYRSEDVTYDDNQDDDIEVLGDSCSVTGDEEIFECSEVSGDGACLPEGACR